MSSNKAQTMIIDILLLIIVLILFIAIINKSNNYTKTINLLNSKNQNEYADNLLITILNSYAGNSTILEKISMEHCNNENNYYLLNESVFKIMNKIGKEDNYFIFIYNKERKRAIYNNYSCIKTEHISLASIHINLPCNKNTDLILGTWPKSQKVETC